MKKAFAVLAGAAALALAPAAASAATPQPVTCDGALQNQVVGALTIPHGTDCTLTKVIVLGDVTGDPSAGNVTLDRTIVYGGANLVTPASLTLDKSVVSGRLRVVSSFGSVAVARSAVGADAQVVGTSGDVRLSGGNIFGGSVLVDHTFGTATLEGNIVTRDLAVTANEGDVSITRNLVGDSLDCSDNVFDPTGGSNAAEQRLGQCASL